MGLNIGILGLQIIGTLFSLLMLYTTFLHQRRKEFTPKESIFWFGTWICLLILSAVPNILDFFVVKVLTMERRIDFFVVCGLVFLTGMIFHIYILVRKNQNKLEKLVREIALEKDKPEK